MKKSNHGRKSNGERQKVLIDSTVQEKNITFPTDSKLLAKVVNWCWKIAEEHGLKWWRSFRREIKEVIRTINFCRGLKNVKKVSAARRRLKIIAGALFLELWRKRPEGVRGLDKVKNKLEIFSRILKQKKNDKNKVYSPHEAETLCIAKGRSHKKYGFGSKVCFVVGKNKGVILAALNFDKNLYDGDTAAGTLEQMSRILSYRPSLRIAEKGFRGRHEVMGMKMLTPVNQGRKISEAEKQQNRKRNKRGSAIEPVIGYLKSDFRMARNFLKDPVGNSINALMSAAAFNFKKWMRLSRLYSVFTLLPFLVRKILLQTKPADLIPSFTSSF